MDVDYVMVGLAVPIATFLGVWLWRLRSGTGRTPWDEAPARETELAQSVTDVRVRLDELRDQVSRWSRDLEEQDRKLAERISGLIGRAEKANEVGEVGRSAVTPGSDGRGAAHTRHRGA